ncbi:MAG: biotin--[acetyl-CoA-carboxylase] ligase [Pseudomonadota bacterium]
MTAPITRSAIAALCQDTTASSIIIEIVERTGSTNQDLLARVARASAPNVPTFLLALTQTAGRGRAGRVWHSDGCGLTFSLAWPIRRPVSAISGLSLAVGVAIAEVLAAQNIDVALKWPNDVLLKCNKLAGVLIETVEKPGLLQDGVWAVIGIGINMAGPPSSLTKTAADHGAVKRSAALPSMDRNVLVAALLASLAETLRIFEQRGFAAFAQRWNALHAHAGQVVDIFDGVQVRQHGCALGVDAAGHLLLQTENGQVAIVAGDVSLRAASSPQHSASHPPEENHAAAD